MPAVRGDGMRGLAVFISDIRNCKSKEAEVKRINKELANIRSKFKVSKFKPIKSSIYKFIQNDVCHSSSYMYNKYFVVGRQNLRRLSKEKICMQTSFHLSSWPRY